MLPSKGGGREVSWGEFQGQRPKIRGVTGKNTAANGRECGEERILSGKEAVR